MGMWIGRNRKARVTYGFDEIALVPGRVTINPNEVDIAWRLPRRDAEPLNFKIPILASAMDGVVDVLFAIEMSKLGGLAVLNLEGVQTRYKNPKEVLQKIVEADKAEITGLLQKIYQEPVQEDLIAARIRQIKDSGAIAAVSSIPQRAAEFGRIAQEAGADVFVVQSTVSTVRHLSSEYKSLELEKFCREMRIPVIVGNTVGYDVTFEIMECGPAAVLIGVGPRRGLHFARRPRPRRAAGDGDRRLRGGARRLFQENFALRSDHHRRRHEQGRRCLQSARLRRGCRHGRQRVCQGLRSARAPVIIGAWRRRTRICPAAPASKSARPAP